MATTRPRKTAAKTRTDDDARLLSLAEGRQLFDDQVRERLGISGEEFLRRWDAGEYDASFDDPRHHSTLVHLWMLSPFGR
jgi:hypothetical protein